MRFSKYGTLPKGPAHYQSTRTNSRQRDQGYLVFALPTEAPKQVLQVPRQGGIVHTIGLGVCHEFTLRIANH